MYVLSSLIKKYSIQTIFCFWRAQFCFDPNSMSLCGWKIYGDNCDLFLSSRDFKCKERNWEFTKVHEGGGAIYISDFSTGSKQFQDKNLFKMYSCRSPYFYSVIRQRKSLCPEPVWMLVDSLIHWINQYLHLYHDHISYIMIMYHISPLKCWKYWGPVYILGESFSPNRYILWDKKFIRCCQNETKWCHDLFKIRMAFQSWCNHLLSSCRNRRDAKT